MWSWQNVVLETSIVAGTNTEAVFSAWSGVYASIREQIWSDLASQLYVVEKKYPWTSNPGCYVVSQFSLKTISPSGSTLRHSWDNAGYGTLCPIQPVGSLETFIFLHIKNKCLSWIFFFCPVRFLRMWRIVETLAWSPTSYWMREPRSPTKTVWERPSGLCWDMDTTSKPLTRTMVQNLLFILPLYSRAHLY